MFDFLLAVALVTTLVLTVTALIKLVVAVLSGALPSPVPVAAWVDAQVARAAVADLDREYAELVARERI